MAKAPLPASPIQREQREFVTSLRCQGYSWTAIAEKLRARYRINMRIALRLAHGWSQADAAEEWNRKYPRDTKTDKTFSYWELWPRKSGRAPSLESLTKLADLYQCDAADLISDIGNYRSADKTHQASPSNGTNRTQHFNTDNETTPGLKNDLISELDNFDMHELSSQLSEQFQTPLLLKLNAALSLAIASSGNKPAAAPDARIGADAGNLSGIWHSRYVYPSTGRNNRFTSEHFMVVRHNNDRLTAHSLPHTEGSRLFLDLALDKPVATGTWQEHTSPSGYYRGSAYHGTLQLTLELGSRRMTGMWIGFGKNFAINSGEWQLTQHETSTKMSLQRAYRLRI